MPLRAMRCAGSEVASRPFSLTRPPRIAQDIWRIVRRVRESGIATVIVDKNFRAVNAITDRNVILVKGRVVYEGAAADLLAQPQIHRAHLGV